MSVQVSYKNQFLFGIMLMLVVLVVAEGLANVWWYQVNACAFEDNELFEDLTEEEKRQLCLENIEIKYTEMGLEPNQKSQTININSDGFRGPEITKEKQENTYRIVVIGGSTTFGSGVKDNETPPAFLQKIFDSKEFDFNIEVINAGVPGAWSQNEVLFIKEKIIGYEPDLLIVYDGVNDLQHFDQGEGPELWMERWIDVCNQGKEEGFDTIITIQPFLGTGNRIPTEQEYPYFVEGSIVDRVIPYSLYVEQLEKLDDSCTKTADLRKIFDYTQETIFFDTAHVNSLGNKIIAENFYEISYPLIQNKASEIKLDNNENSKNTNKKNSEIPSIDVIDDSLNSIKSQFLSYKTPRILLHISTVFENSIFDKSSLQNENVGRNYIISNKESCERLGGVWNQVYICIVDNLTINEEDTLQIEPAKDLLIRKKLVNYGTIILNDGGINNFQGELINEGGNIIVNDLGFFRNTDGGTITNNAGSITLHGSFYNLGEINNNFESIISINLNGQMYNFGDIINNGGEINNNGIFKSTGKIFNQCDGTIVDKMKIDGQISQIPCE